MTLNFPGDTSQPYIDPISGLKYLFNNSIGAWETAIQPPAVISDTKPQLTMPGFLWWDSVGGSLYVYYKDVDSEQWVEVVPAGGSGAPVSQVTPVEPADPRVGDIWIDTSDPSAPLMYVWGTIGGQVQWILVNRTGSPFAGAYAGPDIVTGVSAPGNPQRGDIWYDTENEALNIYHEDWIVINSPQEEVAAQLTTSGALSIASDVISVRGASTTETGVVRMATQAEVNEGGRTDVAVSPGKLKQGIKHHLPAASATAVGVISLATASEVVEGTNEVKAITPKVLKSSINSLGVAVPAGTVINYAGASAPNGYLACDGSNVSRSTYSSLYSAIGTTYGIGDGNTTFTLPTVTGEMLYCIKH